MIINHTYVFGKGQIKTLKTSQISTPFWLGMKEHSKKEEE
jgi:hypothetical protein